MDHLRTAQHEIDSLQEREHRLLQDARAHQLRVQQQSDTNRSQDSLPQHDRDIVAAEKDLRDFSDMVDVLKKREELRVLRD